MLNFHLSQHIGKHGMNKVIVVGKPSHKIILEKILVAKFPNDQLKFIYLDLLQLETFKYPHGLRLYDYPFIKIPEFKNNPINYPENEDPYTLVRQADEVIFAADFDYHAAFSFQLLVFGALGSNQLKREFTTWIFTGFTDTLIEKAIDNPSSTGSHEFRALVQYGTAKRYFDFNFNVNSMCLFGKCLRYIGVSTTEFIATKFPLQMLYWLNNHPEPHAEMELTRELDQWRGSGKYSQPGSQLISMGSAPTRHLILKTLVENNLVSKQDHSYQITKKGKQFIKLLHPECYDPDLPYRLDTWCHNWPQSREAIDRYFHTYFSRQKRFNQNRFSNLKV